VRRRHGRFGGNGNGRQSARPLVSALVALFTGVGIVLQQLSTGQPLSAGRWAMLIVGSAIGGVGGLLAAGLFDPSGPWYARRSPTAATSPRTRARG
jgi:hypothetical protein